MNRTSNLENLIRMNQAADLLSRAATMLEELENEVGEDEGLHEAYEHAYSGMCNLYNRTLEMRNSMKDDGAA